MGLFSDIALGLWKILCGSQPVEEPKPYPKPSEQQEHAQAGSHRPSHAQRPHTGPSHPPFNQNQVNQTNEHYLSLRARANEEGDQMARCFEQSHQAYSNGNGALAKETSDKGKAHKQRMEELNKQASDWIFTENNKDSQPGEVDLHGLYVKEAIARTDQAIQEARRRGDRELRLIVGKGLHSQGGTAKIKLAIEELMQKQKLVAELDSDNGGVVIVHFDSAKQGGIGAGDIVRRLENNGESCIIM